MPKTVLIVFSLMLMAATPVSAKKESYLKRLDKQVPIVSAKEDSPILVPLLIN